MIEMTQQSVKKWKILQGCGFLTVVIALVANFISAPDSAALHQPMIGASALIAIVAGFGVFVVARVVARRSQWRSIPTLSAP